MVTIFAAVVAERKEGRSMERCWLLGGEALEQNFWNGKQGGPGSVSGEVAVLYSCVCSKLLFSLRSKSVFQELNEPTSSMEGVKAGL